MYVSLMSLAGAGRGLAGLDKRPRHPGGRLHPAHRGAVDHGLQRAAVQLPQILQSGQLSGHLHAGIHRDRPGPAQSCGEDTSRFARFYVELSQVLLPRAARTAYGPAGN